MLKDFILKNMLKMNLMKKYERTRIKFLSNRHFEFSKNNCFREQRQHLFSNFIKAGGPGIKLKTDYDKLIRTIVYHFTLYVFIIISLYQKQF